MIRNLYVGLLFILLFIVPQNLMATAGSSCATAILVSSNGCSSSNTYDNTGITGTLTPPTCFSGGNNNGMWFEFVASSTTITATATGATLTNPMIALVSAAGACTAPFTELACNYSGTGSSSLTYANLTIGNTYYLYVDGANNNVGTFQLCLTSPEAPTNDNPCNAIVLPSFNFCSEPNQYTNYGASGESLTSVSLPPCFDATGSVNTVWFQFTAVQSGLTVNINGGGSGGLVQPQAAVILPMTGCSGTTFSATNIACAQASTGSDSITISMNNLIIGATYYIVVDGAGSNMGTFQICLNNYATSSGIPNDSCDHATPLCPNVRYWATTNGGVSSGPAISAWNCNASVDNTAWFKFTTTSPAQKVNFYVNTYCNFDELQFEVFSNPASNPCASPTGYTSLGCLQYGPTGTSSLTIPAASLSPNTTYWLVVDNWPGDYCDFNFTVTGIQDAYAGPNQNTCLSTPAFNLTGFTPAGGTWSGAGITNATLGTFNPSVAGIGLQTLYYTYGGCTESKTILVSGPVVTTSSSVSICTGSGTTLIGDTSVSPGSYPLTFSNATAQTIPDNNATGTTSTIAVSGVNNTSCGANVPVSVNFTIAHTHVSDLSVYLKSPAGTMILLSGANGGSGQNYYNTTFTTSATNPITSSSDTAPYSGIYSPQQAFALLNGNAINGNWSLIVKDLSSSYTGTLQNWSMTFENPNNVVSYVWTPTTNMTNSSSLSPTVNPTSTTIYKLTATDALGCSNSSSDTITVVTPPTVTVANVTSCQGVPATLTATPSSGGGTYAWSPGGATTVSISASPASTTPYTVTYSNNACGGVTGTGTLNVLPAPNVSIAAPAPLTCSTSNTTLTASSSTTGATFNWGAGITTSTNTVNSIGTYTVTVTDPGNGCTSTASATVTQNLVPPNASIAAPTILTCATTSETLTASSTTVGATFNWGGGITTSTNVVSSPATYTVIVTDPANGCTASASKTVTQNITAPNAGMSVPTVLTCSATTETLTASSTTGGAIFNWGGGVTTTTKSVSAPATYTVTVTNPVNGCTNTASATVTQNITAPNASIAAPTVLTCATLSETLTSSSTTAGATFNWGGGITTATKTVSVPGSYTVTVTDPSNGCTSSASATVTQNITAPNASIAAPVALTCTVTSETLTASSTTGGATFNWGGGITTAAKTVATPATYTVTVTDPANGCTSTASSTVTQNITAPNASVAVPTVLTCTLTSETLTASSTTGGATFNWSGGITTATYSVSVPAIYIVTVTNPANGCTNTATATVTQNITVPNASVAAPVVLTCSTTSETLSASSTTGGATFNWGAGVTTATNTISVPTTYTVTVTNPVNGCTNTASVTVSQNITAPNASIGAPTVLTCAIVSETLTASSTTGGATFNWSGGGTTATKTVSTPGTYTVTVTDPTNGCTSTASTVVTQNINAPNASIAAPTILTCTTTSETLTASSSTGGATFNWGGGITTATKVTAVATTYTVTVTDPSNGCTNTASAVVSQNITIPNASIAAPTVLTCSTLSETLTASSTTGGATFNWGGGITTTTNTVSAPATYTVTVTNPANGCTNTASTTVTQNIAVPNASVAAPVVLTCGTTSETLTASSTTGGATFSWGGGVTTATNSVSTPATYTVTVTNPANGCTTTASATVTQNVTAPNASIAAPTVLTCATTTETLTASSTTAGATFNWGGGITTATKTVSAPSAYTVTVTDPANGCTSTATTTVTQNIATPNASIAAPTVLNCTSTSETLTASSTTGGATFNWGGGLTTATKVVSVPSTYTVTITDPVNGCTNTAAATVTQNITPPNVSIAAPAILTCTTASETLTASSTTGGATFDWGAGITTATNTVSSPAVYTVTVTSPINGCTSTASATVTQNIVAPNAAIATPSILTCSATSATLTASSTTGGATYNWGGGITTATNTVNVPATYTVTVTSPTNGCTNTASATVSQNIAAPNAGIAAPTVLTCATPSETLTASSTTAGATFNWGGGITTSTKTVSAPSTYTVTVTDPSNGCTSTASAAVTQNITTPNASVSVPAVLTCTSPSETLTASSTNTGAIFNWGGGVTTPTKVVSSAATYVVTVTDPSNGCTNTASATVTQDGSIPNISISSPAVLTCTTTSETLTASSTTAGATFNWGGGITTATYTVSIPATYAVTVTNPANGCTASNSVTVIQNTVAPNASIATPAILTCTNISENITASSTTTSATFNWGGGVNTSINTINLPATYTVTVTDPVNGCTQTASATVMQNITTPNANIDAPGVLTCATTSEVLTASSTTTGATFNWGGGITTITRTVTMPGSYAVTVTDPTNGCTVSVSATVIQNVASPNTSIALPAVLTCSITSETLTASSTTTGATFNWGGGITTATKSVSAPANYSITVTDPTNGCTSSATTTVTQNITAPGASIATPTTLTCAVTSVTLTASSATAGITFNWGGGITTATSAVTTPSTYAVTITDPTNGCTSTASSTVIQNIIAPGVSIAAPALLTCTTTSQVLTASSSTGGVNFNWGAGITTASNTITTPGNYSVTATNPVNGCTSTASINVIQNIATPSASISVPTILTCSNTSATLTATSAATGATFSWSTGITTANITVTIPANYVVTVTDPANGCTSTASTTVTQNITAPNAGIAPPTPITCAVPNETLAASSTTTGATFNWGGGISTATLTISAPGNYSVTATDPSNGCTTSASATVVQNTPVPEASIATPVTLTCITTSQTLTASSTTGGATFDWGGGNNTTTNTVSIPGYYVVTVTDPSNGCTNTAAVTVSQNITSPSVSIAPAASLTCLNTSDILTASSTTTGTTFNWGGGITTSTKSILSPAIYTVTATDPTNGCTSTASTTVTQNIVAPVASIATPSVLTCSNVTQNLTASSSAASSTYNWGAGVTMALNPVSAPGSYSVTVTDVTNGCTASASVSVSQNIVAPNVTIATPAVLTCSNLSETLTASSTTTGATFNWGAGNTSSSYIVTSPATYAITVTDPANGCTASATITVAQNIVAPNAAIATPSILTCSNISETLTASSTTTGATYDWGGGITSATTVISNPGNYTVTVTDPANACSTHATTTVTQNIAPPNVAISPSTVLTCSTLAVTLTASSTTSSATFDWGGGVTTVSNTVSTAGNYTITVTDPANDCTSTASTSVTQNIASPSVSIAPPSVITCSSPSVALVASSTTTGATFSWSGGATTATATVSTPGNYNVTATDPSNGCTNNASTTVAQNITAPGASIAPPTVLTCANSSETLSATSTTTGATFDWGAGITTANNTVTTPSNYTVTVTDPTNGCKTTASVIVTQNITSPNATVAAPSLLTCVNSSTTLSASSTISGVMFDWGGGNTTTTNTVTTPSNYSVTVTDPTNGCSTIASATVTQNIVAPNVSIATPGILSCTNLTESLNASSTTTGATFDWGGGNTSSTYAVSSPGSYSLTVTDAFNGCTSTASTTVAQNILAPTANIAVPAVLTCSNLSSLLSASSTTPNPNFNWGGGITTASTIVSLSGNYTVTITDPTNGCTSSASTTVTQNVTAPNVNIAPPSVLTCTANSQVLMASSTTTGAVFNWGAGVTTANNTITNPGTYSVTVSDPSNGCTASAGVIVTQTVNRPNVSIAVPAVLTCTVTSTTLTASSTTPGVTFDWGGGVTTATYTVDDRGPYSVTVTDPSNSCSTSASTTVTQNINAPQAGIAAPGILTCTNTSETLTASSTTPGATFDWGGGITTASTTVTVPATYTVVVTDPVNGCNTAKSITVTQNITAPVASIASVTPLTCVNLIETLTASSSAPGSGFDWGAGITTATNTVSIPATYSVTVTDPTNGCTGTSSVSVVQNTVAPNASISAPVALTCTTTSQILTATSTTNNATFNWGGGITTATNTVSSPASYAVTVTDPVNGCTAAASVSITQVVTPPNASIAAPVVLTCAVASQTLRASSTTNGATFNWGGGITTTSSTVTSPGPYTVTVTDPSNGCTNTASVTVTQNITAPGASIAAPANLTCTTISAALIASSPVTGATFNWGGGITTANNSVSSPGNYTVTVTDPTNGCSASTSTTVTQNLAQPNLSILPHGSLSCHITSVVITAASTTAGATYNWGGAITTANNTVTAAGSYVVTATNPVTGCTASATTSITTTSAPVPVAAASNVLCNGGSTGAITVTTTGGIMPYHFMWSNNATTQNLTGLGAGTYNLSVTDSGGCVSTLTQVITQPALLQLSGAIAAVSCAGLSNGSVHTTLTGGVSPYQYSWNTGATAVNLTGAAAGSYSVTITDNNHCTTTMAATINQPVALSISENSTNATCFGLTNGSAQLSAQGGTQPYTFTWQDQNTSQNRASLAAGNYLVTVSDANHCTASTTVEITQPAAINIAPAIKQPTCIQNGSDGSIALAATGGDSVYHYAWSTGSVTDSIVHLAAGNYYVTVTDTKGCEATQTYALNYQFNFTVNASPSVTINLGQNTELGYTINGDAGNIASHIWAPAATLSCADCTNPVAAPNETTRYKISIENQAGCRATDTVTVYVVPDYAIFIPNAFTPNGDGNNDVFRIFGNLQGVEYIEAMVFNRWGEKVFESHDYNFQWDGTYKGVLQEPQVFVYQIKFAFLDGHVEPVKAGSVTLLR